MAKASNNNQFNQSNKQLLSNIVTPILGAFMFKQLTKQQKIFLIGISILKYDECLNQNTLSDCVSKYNFLNRFKTAFYDKLNTDIFNANWIKNIVNKLNKNQLKKLGYLYIYFIFILYHIIYNIYYIIFKI